METLSFADYFWDDKNQGFDVLYQNMKAGVKSSTEFLEFLRDIYSMEDSCTKSWNKLSKQVNINSSGSLQPYWQALKELSDKRSFVHMELSQNIQSIIKSVQKYVDEQQLKQKASKDVDLQTQNLNNLLLNTGAQLVKAKEVYHTRFCEYHKLYKSDQNNATKSRDMERFEAKLKKAVDDYKYLIEKYNNTCTKFKSKMIESCKSFQEIEIYHLDQMKDFICRFVTSLFKAQNDLNQQRTEFEKTQEKLTVETLLNMFVKSKTTGRIQPALATFEDAENADIKVNGQKLPKENSETSTDSGLNGNHSGDVATGNLVNIDSSSDISSTHVSNVNLATQNTKDSMNDLFDQLSNISDNNSINFPNVTNEPNNAPIPAKKDKKFNNIFRRKRNSPQNQKPFQDTEKEKSSQSLKEFMVDEEGYSIKPDQWNDQNAHSSSNSSSEDDQPESMFKGIKIEIKPQENKSDSSSIADSDIQTKKLSKTCDNLELINAVKAFKISPNIFRETGRRAGDSRSNTPSYPIVGVDTAISQSSSGISSNNVSIRDSRRNKCSKSNSEESPALAQPHFQIEFNTSFESNGLDLAGISDSFNSRFDSFSESKVQLPNKLADNSFDPWDHSGNDKQSQPPPLPAKIVPSRAASTVPFTHSKIDTSRFNSLPQNTINIPATPSRLSINTIEGIPLAIAFTETVNAKFRESFSTTPHDVHTSGQLVISFPCSMLQQFESIGENQLNVAEPIHFCLTQANRLRNVESIPSSKDIILKIENPTDDSYAIYIDLYSLHRKLTSLRHQKPSLPFFNVDIIRYDVTNSVRANGSINAPVHISSSWQTTDPTTSHLNINYNFQWPNTEVGSLTFRPSTAKTGNSEVKPHGEVRFIVIADGQPEKMQSYPACNWNSELHRASWRIELSTNQSNIKSKFTLSNGPGTPQPVACQFSAEGSIESGVLLQVTGNRFRISRHKYRLISGRYVWEPSSNTTGFCV